jgi:hypothetical protein
VAAQLLGGGSMDSICRLERGGYLIGCVAWCSHFFSFFAGRAPLDGRPITASIAQPEALVTGQLIDVLIDVLFNVLIGL